jgi:RNA polymerase sigma-70 factor (ECF subfamily)
VAREIRGSAFRTTHWTVILEAADPGDRGAPDAFARLYSDYWYPLYAYVRRRGHSPHEAEDITQDFFLHLLEKPSLAGLQREGGKFRSFLLRSLDNFLVNQWGRARASKRGGGTAPQSIDASKGETRFALAAQDTATPETLFERQWAFSLLAIVLERLRAECAAAGKDALFEGLRPHLQGERSGPAYAEVASRHGLSEGAVKVAAHRLRQRYGEMLRDEIARTVSAPEEVDEELRHLIAVCGS